MKVDLERSEKRMMEEMCLVTPYGWFKDRPVQDAKRKTDRFTRLITFPYHERLKLTRLAIYFFATYRSHKKPLFRSDKTVAI